MFSCTVSQMMDIGYGSQFFYVDDSGRVRVRDTDGLESDVGTLYTLVVTAHDSTFPSMKATSSVTINVNRNPSAPTWPQQTYLFNITDRFDFVLFCDVCFFSLSL